MNIRPALAAALFAALAGCLAAAVAFQDGPRERGEDALRDRDYPRAAALLAEALGAAQSGRDEILYLLAVAQARGGKTDEALATLDRLLREHPESPLRRKAAFKRGDVLAARKDFAAASAIYDDGLKAIVDPARRKSLAAVFLETARELLVPKDAKDSAFKPDYVAALGLLQKALDLEALDGDAEAAARADVVRCHANGAIPEDLLAACLAFEEKFPASARLDEVLFAKGEALRRANRLDHAGKAWIGLADRFPASPKAADALLRAAALGLGRGGEGLRASLQLSRRAAKAFAATPDGPRAAMALADVLSTSPELREEARAAYQAVVDGFPKDERAPQALSRIADLRAQDGDDANAIDVLDGLLKRYPDSPLWPAARQRIADLRFDRLRRARLRKDWAGLRAAAQSFADAHATDPRESAALSEWAAAFREEKKFREAADAYLRIAAKYEGTDPGQQARLDAATTLAEDLGEIETALKELERVKGSRAAAAEAFARRLREPSLALSSERVFTSAEAPAASLTARNIETVRFRLWTLDLRDYFDKKSSTSGLQDLEVAVIAPDQEWELKVPGYARYKEFKLPAPLPKKDPGAYVVLASAGALEAKTVVLVGDLALVARAGRQGATVLVQNQRTGERVAAPSLLTAADGKALKAWTADTTANRLSFLASDGGHAAFRDLNVQHLPVPPKRAATALLIPDRHVVRADEDVRVRIWIRDAAGNAYVPPKDKAYRLVAATGSETPFWDVDVLPSPLGAASVTFRPPAAAHGAIRLSLVDRAKPRDVLGQAVLAVGVDPARLPRVDFLRPDAPVFAGDDVDVPCVLRDEWGRPVPGRRVEVTTDADLSPRNVITGADGAFLISFRETRLFGLDGLLLATVAHGNRSEILLLPVLSRTPIPAFEASSRFGEPAAAGEARAIAFTAKTADGAPFSGPFKWSVVLRNAADEPTAVAAGDVATDAQGRATFSFTPKERGPHVVKVVAKDADGVPARAVQALEVFDDGEESKIRILSASDVFEPGVPFEVTVLSRLEKGTAFVTVEGETVEQALPVALEKGRTVVKLAPPPGKSKDFTVTVLAMRDGKFHADVRPFLLKTPELKIEPARKSVRPGEEVAVKVSGRPGAELLFVATEKLATAAGPKAFVDRRPGEYFIGDSSVETSFAGVTKELDAQVIHAMARLEKLESAGVRVMMPTDLPQDPSMDLGGKGEGRFGSRMGGKRNVVARGGGGGDGGSARGAPDADPTPIVFAAATIGPDGTATFAVRAPFRRVDLALAAWTLDGSNLIGHAFETLNVRADVTAEIRAPESAVEGEKTSIVVLLTNRSGEEREAVLALHGAETRVKVPARSTLERALDWTAAATATVALDGLPRELRTSIRPKPSTWTEAGGAFSARTELKLDGEGKTIVRYATSPEAFLDSLAEPDTSVSGGAARLIARLARHRIAPSGAARLAVMEFAAWRRPDGADEAREDEAWPVLAYLAAAEAKADGFEIEPDAAPLKERFARAAHDDVKALQLFALARGGETQYGYLHRLWRNPDALSPRALACVALALKSLARPDEAKDAAARLAKRVKEDHWDAVEVAAADLSNTTYVATALSALALAEIEPANAALPKARAWLLARSPSGPFERAALAMALRSTPDRSALTALRIGGREVSGAGEIAVDDAAVEPVGQGTFYVLARRATGRAPEPPAGVTVKRTIGWPGLVVEGRPVHGRSTTDETPSTPMTRVAAGQGFQIHYEITVKGPLTGYRVVELDRVAGLRNPRTRVLVAPSTSDVVKFRYDVHAYADVPGPSPVLEILPPGSDFRAGWTPSAVERLEAGAILFESRKWKEAREFLLPIFDAPSVPDALAAPAARLLAFSAAELGEHETVVRFFEVLKEKAPLEVIPFDKIRAVGRAYAAAKEFERAMQVVSGTCDAYFLQEANLPGALEDLGRTRASTERMKALLLDHPDTALNREMRLGLGTRLASAARTAEDVVQNPLTMPKAELLAEAAAALERFLAWHPEDPAGDRASLTLGSVHLEAGNYARAERTSKAAAARYPKSRFLDGFDYTTAFAQFARRSFADALAMCDRLETFDYGANSNPGPAVMRERAILMKAQIHHAKGELDKALENYKKVRDASPDAARSVAFLEREAISVPETTSAPLARPAEIELEYAGVSEARVRAYKVDLTTLALRRKELSDPAAVEVAGIRPVFEKTFKLDVPNAKRREKQKLALDLKAPGAYLVGVKAGDFFAGGLVLRGDLALAVQEEGAVRVNVTNTATGAFAEGVKVTVVSGGKIDVLKTDLRGVAESDEPHDRVTVVAEKDGHVAMYQGAARRMDVQRPMPAQKAQQLDALQEQLKDANKQLEDDFRGNQRRMQQGVEVERTKK